jgi:uncharacterized protein YbcI
VEESPADGKPSPLGGRQLLAAISTNIVAMLREHCVRGPTSAKTYVLDDIIVVVMRGSGFIPLEKTIVDSGEPELVIAMREGFQRVMACRFRQMIEDLTGRNVVAFVSRVHLEPDITMESFFMDGPLRGLARWKSQSQYATLSDHVSIGVGRVWVRFHAERADRWSRGFRRRS